MPSLTAQKDFRRVQRLSFCYLCGKTFGADEKPNKDHVPPQGIFLAQDREPLWLPTHEDCNSGQTETDEKIGQLIALKYGKAPSDPKHRRLDVTLFSADGAAALTNLDVDDAVWRWVRGCHAALYHEPLIVDLAAGMLGAMITPFPRGSMGANGPEIEQLKIQHLAFVKEIKINRAKLNLDRVSSNKGRFLYECVWNQADNNGPWMCMFAINIYDWKDLGRTPRQPARGCAGFYQLQDGGVPASATHGVGSSILIPNLDPLDPFGR